jgi:hypothetical protein
VSGPNNKKGSSPSPHDSKLDVMKDSTKDRLIFAAITVGSLTLSPFFFQALSGLIPGSVGIFVSLALFMFYYAYLIHISTHILSELKGPIAQLIPVTLLLSVLICYVLAFIPWSWDILPAVNETWQGYITHFYFIVQSFTSVGYGDITPESTAGRLFASMISLLGAAHAIGFLTILLLKVEHGKRLSLEELPEKTGSDEAPSGHSDSQKTRKTK